MHTVDTLPAAATTRGERRADVRSGVVAMLPFVAGYAPFALVVGSAVADAASPTAGWSGSWLIYGGSAHLTALRTLSSSGALAAIVTALVVNARLLVYSASLSRTWRGQPMWFRATAAALIIEPTWLTAEQHAARSARAQRDVFLAAGVTLGVGWSAMIAVGALVGGRLGVESLEVAAPLCLIALLCQRRRTRGDRTAMMVAVTVVLLSAGGSVGFLAAVAAGAAAGWLSERSGR